MAGYKLKFKLISTYDIWRLVEVPEDIKIYQLNIIINDIFNTYYSYFRYDIPKKVGSEGYDLDNIVKSYDRKNANWNIKRIFNKNEIVLFLGDRFEIIIERIEKTNYKNKTALILDYEGKYNPLSAFHEVFIFEEIIEEIESGEDAESVLNEYGMNRYDLYRLYFDENLIGSRIKLNQRYWISL